MQTYNLRLLVISPINLPLGNALSVHSITFLGGAIFILM